MLIHDTIPTVGTVFDWDITEILTRASGDVSSDFMRYDECQGCGEIIHGEDWSECEHGDGDRKPISIPLAWSLCLDEKRGDDHYPDVVESIETHGFVRPLTATEKDGRLTLGDGHHRLAAAIELGMTSVPVQVTKTWGISPDSGEWWVGDPIPTLNSNGSYDFPED